MIVHQAAATAGVVSVPGSASVHDALALLETSGQAVLVVRDGDRPVGIVTAADLEGTPGHRPRDETPVEFVMTQELVASPPDASALDTLRIYTEHAWRSLERRRPCAGDVVARRCEAYE